MTKGCVHKFSVAFFQQVVYNKSAPMGYPVDASNPDIRVWPSW